jgi:peptide/nickel transport system permease protein
VSSFVVFGALYLAPGSALGALTGGRPIPPSEVVELKHEYHLDQPFYERFWSWLGGAVHGHLGTSIVSRVSVSTLIGSRIGTTLLLVAYASALILVLSPLIGVIGGASGGVIDKSVVAATSALAAVPSFVAAVVLVELFAVKVNAFPVFGSGAGFIDKLWHLTLPAIALALAGIGYCARVARTATIAELRRDHVQTAVSRGFSMPWVLRRHVVRNSLVPISTAAGVTVAGMFAGAVVVEQAFGLNGIGSLLLQSIQNHDFAVVKGVSLVLVSAFVVVNAIVDVLYAVFDPRIQVGARA